MRIAFVDLLFSWPPPGGAQANLYHTIYGLQNADYEVHLFAPIYTDMWRQGHFDPAALPFPATALEFKWEKTTIGRVQRQFRQVVDTWRPDVVFIGFGRYFKPYLIEALAKYPVVSRYFMYEHLCILNGCLYKENETCRNDFLRTPNVCRECTFQSSNELLTFPNPPPYTVDLAGAGVFKPGYHRVFVDALRKCRAAVVNNAMAKQRLEGYCPDVRVVPSGLKVADYEYLPLKDKPVREKKAILMSGRTDDPFKGMDILADAGRGLARHRSDFEIWVTDDEDLIRKPWFRAQGWRDQAGMKALYRDADIVVVPSVWPEPFGRVAVEGMAAGRPVAASRIGGLQEIVRHGETGYLFEAGSSAELALRLERLLDDPERCARMGARGREVALAEYDWERVVEDYYIPLLKDITS